MTLLTLAQARWSSFGRAGARCSMLFAVLMALACAACGSPTEGESEHLGDTSEDITAGQDDNGDDAVVALMLAGQTYCTGILISPYVVATAAHCVLPTPPDQVYFGAVPGAKPGVAIAVTETTAHPDFDADTLDNDIGVVALATKGPVPPAIVHRAAFDHTMVNAPLRLVGFGATGANGDLATRKRTGHTVLSSYGDLDFTFHPGPSQTCNGDSGGPAFMTFGGRQELVGLTSSGDADCAKFGRDIRIDKYLAFIDDYSRLTAYSVTNEQRIALSMPSHSNHCAMSQVSAARGSQGAMFVFFGLLVLAAVRRLVSKQRFQARCRVEPRERVFFAAPIKRRRNAH